MKIICFNEEQPTGPVKGDFIAPPEVDESREEAGDALRGNTGYKQ